MQSHFSTHMSSNSCAVELQAWNLAAQGKKEEFIALYEQNPSNKQFILDMGLMGASKAKQNEMKLWCWMNGASLLWSIQQAPKLFVKESKDTNNQLKRLNGPGEIARGTFARHDQ